MKTIGGKRLFLILFFVSSVNTLFAQGGKFIDSREVDEHLKYGNYFNAIKVLRDLLKKDPNNADFNYKMGQCYLHTNINKSLAVQYLEVAVKDPKVDPKAWFALGKAYHYDLKLDQAIEAYTTYKQKMDKDKAEQEIAERHISMCNNAKQFVKFPLDIKMDIVSKEVNSDFPDYYPFVSDDESIMAFTSRRKGNIGGGVTEVDGYFSSDVWISTVKDGKWQKAQNIGSVINTRLDEQAVGMSPDGNVLTVYIDHIDSLGNIYTSNRLKGNKFTKLKKLPKEVNAGFETSGSMSIDSNTIFFSSQREGGLGETDIYMCRRLPNGNWALAQNLGSVINTPYKEDFPRLAADGTTLYFASQGHSSMGDFDIFKSTWDPETNRWTTPVNLGYPINDPYDNHCISYTNRGFNAYVSSLRFGGFGDLDIYRITFNTFGPRYTVIKGSVFVGDSTSKEFTQANILVVDPRAKVKTEYKYRSSKENGSYIMALPPGIYNVVINLPGYKQYEEELIVFDLGSFQSEVQKNIFLQKSP